VADRHVVRRTPSEELGFVLAQPVAPGAVEESEEGTDLELFMRPPVIAPADLSPEQRSLYEDMRTGIEKNFHGFKAISDTGALIGPWNQWLHEPRFGKPIWDLVKALSTCPSRNRCWGTAVNGKTQS
jgi:hypothetical protein